MSASVKVADLMSKNVVGVSLHDKVGRLKTIFTNNSFSTLPVLNENGEPVGIVSVSDLIADVSEGTPVSKIMTERVYTVPEYNDVEMAARIMRNHKIHHVVVVHEKRAVGVISSFDLLKLVEGHRFVMKPTGNSGKARGKRAQVEVESE